MVGVGDKTGSKSYRWKLVGGLLHGVCGDSKYSSDRLACQGLMHYLRGSPIGVIYYVPKEQFKNLKKAQEWCDERGCTDGKV